MAKIQIKSEKPTPFGGFFSIIKQFDSTLSSVIDSTLGLRCRSFGYRYSEIIRSLMSIYFCGGSCTPGCHYSFDEYDGYRFSAPIWHLAKEDELENLHDKQKKMHPGDAYIYNININNKKKIYKYIKEKYIASMLSISRMHKIPQKERRSLKIVQEIYSTMWHKMMIHTMLS